MVQPLAVPMQSHSPASESQAWASSNDSYELEHEAVVQRPSRQLRRWRLWLRRNRRRQDIFIFALVPEAIAFLAIVWSNPDFLTQFTWQG